MIPSAPAELAFGIRRGHSLAVVHGTHRAPRFRSPRRPSARPVIRLLRALLAVRCPGSGAVCSLVRLAPGTVPPVLPRVSARQPEPTAGWRDCPRLRSLLAANQWIAETSAVVEQILRRPSPHSLPIESLLLPEAKARPRSSRARNRGVLANAGGRVGTVAPGRIIRTGSTASQGRGQSPGGRRERSCGTGPLERSPPFAVANERTRGTGRKRGWPPIGLGWLISIRSVRYCSPQLSSMTFSGVMWSASGVVEIPLPGVQGDDRGGTWKPRPMASTSRGRDVSPGL